MSSIIDRLSRRLQLMIGRCVIRAAAAGGGRVLVTVDAFDGETISEVELAEPFGLTSVPLPETEGLSLSVMGVRGHEVVLPLGNRAVRPKDLQPGETALFDEQGNRIEIRRDRIRIIAAERLEITAPEATVNGKGVATIDDLVRVGGGSSAGDWPIVTSLGSEA